jgi:hypothetical protein
MDVQTQNLVREHRAINVITLSCSSVDFFFEVLGENYAR